jgi:putative membrane protein
MRRAVLLFAVTAAVAWAHEGRPPEPHDLWSAWAFEPGVVIPLALAALLYWRGSRPLAARGIRRWEAASFWAGWLALVAALVSPLHPLGSALFSAHMAQHEVLMVVAAPLLVLGRPMVPFLWALPFAWRRVLGRVARNPWFAGGWRGLTAPLGAWAFHAVALWVWHAPALFDATLESEWVHTAQHLSFLASALLFWWALVRGRAGRMGYGASALYVFTTAIHTGLLGALLTFAPAPLYPAYAGRAAAWGLSALEDQQLAGLIMWVPAGVVYTIAGLALAAGWIRESETRVLAREREALP